MKSGYILLIFILLFGAIDYWAEYDFFRHTDNDEYSWILYLNAIWALLAIGMIFHKRWALTSFKIILWLWFLIIFWYGLAAADAAHESNGIPSGMAITFKSHWLQFILFGGLLIFIRTDKVKNDFGIVEKKID